MSNDWVTGNDIDTERLATDLERLAEGIRNDEIGNLSFQSTTDADVRGQATRNVRLGFAFTEQYDDCLQVQFRSE